MIALILAMTRKGKVIGKGGKLPWDIPGELEHFRKITADGIIIMGRKTFESIGRPLHKSPNIVVSRSVSQIKGCEVAKSVREAIHRAKKYGKDIFIIGGSQIAKESFPYVDTMLLSYIKKEYSGDTFFPDFDESQWRIESKTDHPEWEYAVYRKNAHRP